MRLIHASDWHLGHRFHGRQRHEEQGRFLDWLVRFIEVEAIDELGNTVPSTQYMTGVVSGVHFQNGVAYLQCDNREIAMGNVVNVLTTEE